MLFFTTKIVSVVNREKNGIVGRLPSYALPTLSSAYIRRASQELFLDHLKLLLGVGQQYLKIFAQVFTCHLQKWCSLAILSCRPIELVFW